MADYDVNVYATDELRQHCVDEYGDGWRASRNVVDHLEMNADIHGFSVDASFITDSVDAPREHIEEEFYGRHRCRSGLYTYSNLLVWWKFHCECRLHTSGDSRLLLTNNGGFTGRAYTGGDPYAVAECGPECAEATTTQRGGDIYGPYHGISTALHEIAHNLMQYLPEETDCDGQNHGQHETGHIQYDSDNHSTGYTPMIINPNYHDCVEPENRCGETVYGDYDHTSTEYSSCTVGNFD